MIILIVDVKTNTERLIEYDLIKQGNKVTLICPMMLDKPLLGDFLILDGDVVLQTNDDTIHRIRQLNKKIIIMVYASKLSNERIIELFNAGIDDYLPKPLLTRELIARIQSRKRRLYENIRSKQIVVGDVMLDCLAHKVFISNKQIVLSGVEYKLLKCLLENEGELLTREKLISCVGTYDDIDNLRIIDAVILKLRKKTKNSFVEIVTIRGFGYRLINKGENI